MQLKELKYIVTLADEGSISRAAERLYMAQSSLSQFLLQYETELGISLFVRTSKGIRPTAAGSMFIDNARIILGHYRLIQNKLDDMAQLKSGSIILGISSFRGKYMIPKILKQFYALYPNVNVEIIEANSKALEEKLIDGTIDLAIIALPLSRLTHEVEIFKKDEILIVADSDHPIQKYAHPKDNGHSFWLDLKDAESYEFILSPYDTMLGNISRQEFKKAGIKFRAANTNITADLAAAMARAGLGLAFTYQSCIEEYPHASYFSIGQKGVFLELALAHPYATYQSNAVKAMEKIIRETFPKEV